MSDQDDTGLYGLAVRQQAEQREVERLRAENEKLKVDLAMFMHLPSLPDDDESITAEWWKSERISDKLHRVGNVTATVGLQVNTVMLNLYPDEDYTLAMKLPAVRTRGDVRQLVKLLGRE